MVYAAMWYGPDLLPMMRSCADTYGGNGSNGA